jgi:hypothetical protein
MNLIQVRLPALPLAVWLCIKQSIEPGFLIAFDDPAASIRVQLISAIQSNIVCTVPNK